MNNIVNSSRLILTISFVLFTISSIAQLKDSTTLVVKKTKDFTINGNGNAAEWNATAYLELSKRKSGSMDYQTKMKAEDTYLQFQKIKLVSNIYVKFSIK